jgi:DNA-binding transcriptional MerR regulator
VRYYERRRLLPTAPRTEGGFRLFTLDTVERVRFIKQAQELGFSLDEIGELLATGGARECRRVRDYLKVKLSEVNERIRLMQEFRKTLARHLAACERELSRHADNAVCPVIISTPRADSGKKRKR